MRTLYLHPLIFIFCSALIYLGIAIPELTWAEPGLPWNNLESRYTIIRYQSVEDLKIFNCRLKFGPSSGTFYSLFSRPKEAHDLKATVTSKVDAIFERVQEILDMRKKMKKVKINIYPNTKQLHKAFFEVYGTKCRIKAWYRFRSNTVYVNVKDVTERILAHELAHSIIDHYLTVRPPRATAEILARYVDLHLK